MSGVYRFSSIVKQNKKAKNYAVFCYAGFFFKFFLCYEVIVKQNFSKRSTNYYLSCPVCTDGTDRLALSPQCVSSV
jgi:hypothetical protein